MINLNFHEIQPNMSEQEKKRQRIYDLLNAEIKLIKISEITGVSLWPPSNPNLKPFDYAIQSVLGNKTNATSHPNFCSLKTATEVGEWNIMLEEFILKACKSFRRRVDTIIKKMTGILSKILVMCLSFYFRFNSFFFF